MDPQPDVIRQQIDETRSSLTEKLETLEAEVKDTVQSARETVTHAQEAVADTLTSVKDSVEHAKETVKRTFDIPRQVDQHPWLMMGLALVSGVVTGAVVGGRMNTGRRMTRRMSDLSAAQPHYTEPMPTREPRQPGFMDKLGSQLGDELEKVKDLAISTLVGVVGDVARKSIPAVAHTVEDMMARAAQQAGARPQQYGPEPSQPVI